MKTNQTQLKDKIRKICTYHSEDDIGGEGTNGYCLNEEQFQKLFALFLSWHQEGVEKYKGIFDWLLGIKGDFPIRKEGEGVWHWRIPLRKKLRKAGINDKDKRGYY